MTAARYPGAVATDDVFSEFGTLSLPAVSAVPEPATVAVMLAGLGVVGGAAARRRKAVREATVVA